jgi:hypothetical protein
MSPNSTDDTTAIQAGWRPDPTGRYEWRYWDGGWTNRVASTRKPGGSATDSSEPRAADGPSAHPATAAPAADGPAAHPAAHPAAAAPPGSPAPMPPAPVPAVPVVTAPPAAAAFAPVAAASAVSVLDDPTAPSPSAADTAVTTEPTEQTEQTEPTEPIWTRARLAVVEFFRSFSRQPESYHSPRAVDIEPDPRGDRMIAGSPGNYGRAAIVAVSACGVAVGSYLPWLSGSIDHIPFSQTGFDAGHGWSYTMGAFALVCAALLAVRVRVVRWVTIALALLLAGFTFRELVHVHDIVTTMNTSATIQANVGTGIWIMTGCAIVALIASCRLGERD